MSLDQRSRHYRLRGYNTTRRKIESDYHQGNEELDPREFKPSLGTAIMFILIWPAIAVGTYLAYPKIIEEQPIAAITIGGVAFLMIIFGVAYLVGSGGKLKLSPDGYEVKGQVYDWKGLKHAYVERQNLFWLFRVIPSSYNTRRFIIFERVDGSYQAFQAESDAEEQELEIWVTAYYTKYASSAN